MMRSGGCSLASLSAWSPLAATSTMASPERSSVCLIEPGDVVFVFDDEHAHLVVAARPLSAGPVMLHGRRLIPWAHGSGREISGQ